MLVGVFGAEDAVLGGEELDEFDAVACAAEDVDGAAALGVEAGLVGEQADAEMAAVFGGEVFEGGEVGGFEDVDAGQDLRFERSRFEVRGCEPEEK